MPAIQGQSVSTIGALFASTESVTAPDDNSQTGTEIGSEAIITPAATSNPGPTV